MTRLGRNDRRRANRRPLDSAARQSRRATVRIGLLHARPVQIRERERVLVKLPPSIALSQLSTQLIVLIRIQLMKHQNSGRSGSCYFTTSGTCECPCSVCSLGPRHRTAYSQLGPRPRRRCGHRQHSGGVVECGAQATTLGHRRPS